MSKRDCKSSDEPSSLKLGRLCGAKAEHPELNRLPPPPRLPTPSLRERQRRALRFYSWHVGVWLCFGNTLNFFFRVLYGDRRWFVVAGLVVTALAILAMLIHIAIGGKVPESDP